MMRLNIKEINTLRYERPDIDKGYANQYLKIDVSRMNLAIQPILPEIKNIFIG